MEERPIELLKAERPVRDPRTLEKFEKALSKGRLLYEYVERVEDWQVALLHNEKKVTEFEYWLIYTSSIDGKIYSRQLDYMYINYKDSVRLNRFKPVHMVAFKPELEGTGLKQGVLKHNGLEVIPLKYETILDVDSTFLHTFLHGIGPSARQYFFDYEGRKYLELTGYVQGCEWEHLNAKVFTSRNEVDKTEDIYVVYNKKIYKCLSLPARRCKISIEKRKITIKEKGVPISKIDSTQFDKLMSKAVEIKPEG